MTNSYELANLALQSVCPNNVILVDEKGVPSVMVKIPKMTYAELGLGDSKDIHPAFIVNGKVAEAIYISKYGNTIKDGVAASLPGVDPKARIRFDEAMEVCNAKGKGWHMMTKPEFALIAQWCLHAGHLPRGNNLDLKDYRDTYYKAIPTGDGHTATGTGPLSWYHDNTLGGIADLNGNTSNWMGGIRLVYGELQLLPDNNGADNSYSQAPDSDAWRAVDGTTGEFIVPDGKGTTPNSLKLDFCALTRSYYVAGWKWVTGPLQDQKTSKRGGEYSNVSCDDTVCPAAKKLLQAYGLLPYNYNPSDYEHCKVFACNGNDDLLVHCGGSYHDDIDSGVFFNRMVDDRDHPRPGIGFRCSYIEF